MKPLLVLLALVALISGCVQVPPRDAELSRLLVGRWFSDEPIGNEYSPHFEKEYFPNGTAEGLMDIYEQKSDKSRGAFVRRITFTSKWRVEGAAIVIWDMMSEPSGFLDPAEVDRDTVLQINRELIRYRTDKGELGENRRMKKKPE